MVEIISPNRRGARTGMVQRPAFLSDVGLDKTDRDDPGVQELVQMIGGGEQVEEIEVNSDSLDEADQIEAALIALRETPTRASASDADVDAQVAQILQTTTRRGEPDNRAKLSVVAAIRDAQAAEDADDDDDAGDTMGLDLREKSDEEIAKIGRLSPDTKKAIEARQGQPVVRKPQSERPSTGRSAAKLYTDSPVKPVPKEPIRETPPEELEEEYPQPPEDELVDDPIAEEPPPEPAPAAPKVIQIPAKRPIIPPLDQTKPAEPQVQELPRPQPLGRPPQVSAERRLARDASKQTEAKVEQQQKVTYIPAEKPETLSSLLDQIEADPELATAEDDPELIGDWQEFDQHPIPPPSNSPMPTTAERLLYTTTVPKFERTLTLCCGGTRIEFWSSGKITVSGKSTGPQLREMILNELGMQDE